MRPFVEAGDTCHTSWLSCSFNFFTCLLSVFGGRGHTRTEGEGRRVEHKSADFLFGRRERAAAAQKGEKRLISPPPQSAISAKKRVFTISAAVEETPHRKETRQLLHIFY